MKTVYEAKDGSRFTTKKAAEAYESDLLKAEQEKTRTKQRHEVALVDVKEILRKASMLLGQNDLSDNVNCENLKSEIDDFLTNDGDYNGSDDTDYYSSNC